MEDGPLVYSLSLCNCLYMCQSFCNYLSAIAVYVIVHYLCTFMTVHILGCMCVNVCTCICVCGGLHSAQSPLYICT